MLIIKLPKTSIVLSHEKLKEKDIAGMVKTIKNIKVPI